VVGVLKSSAYYLASMLFSLSEWHWGWGQVGKEKCSLPLPFNNFTGLKQNCLIIHTLKQTRSAVKIKTMLVYSYCPLNPGYIAFPWSLAHSSPPNLQFSYWQYQVGEYSNLILRTVPTIVTAHMFCASSDTRISYRQCLLIHGYFCAV